MYFNQCAAAKAWASTDEGFHLPARAPGETGSALSALSGLRDLCRACPVTYGFRQVLVGREGIIEAPSPSSSDGYSRLWPCHVSFAMVGGSVGVCRSYVTLLP